ncbi:Hint domain-containing protein [Paenibacillus sp. N4]|uniref:polymorphic toxin-type HINT domain-containing protein n=1 Tax=Paenibacillus vietnamensis TaxID=2590547 RepID=UPI001CD190FE|nr:polymorphic toxin-type HINT domain-containing protein [Paenibacillus vietnamensis]MCA0753723.1 Hint domain-containing protein [Paenibacillus vietnamensis]
MISQTDDLSLAHNLIANSGFENGTTHWKTVGTLGASEKFETVAADSVSNGYKTLHLLSQDGVDVESVFTFPVNEYQKYTFSMSLKTAVQTKATLKVTWTKKDNTKIEQSFTMSGIDTVARDWTRKSTGIEAPADAVKANVQLGIFGAGEAWFDNIAVEGGASRSDDNLVTNAGMEFDADKTQKADEWYPPSESVTGISINYNKFKFGKSSERINGSTGVVKYVKQNLQVDGRAGNKFSLSGWSLGEGIPADAGIKWRIQLNVHYDDGTIGNYGIAFDAANTDWQDVSRIVTAEKDFNDLSVVLMFDNMPSTADAYFDEIKVTRVDAPSTSAVAGYNMIDNSSFEQDYDATNRPDGWVSLSSTNYSEWINLERQDTDPQSSPIDYKKSNTFTGTRSILLFGNTSEDATQVRLESVPVQSGKKYTLVGYGKTVNNAPAAGLLLIALDAAGNELTRIKTPLADKDTDWKRVRYVFDTSMLPANTAKVQVGVYKEADTAGKAFFDNIRLQEGEFRTSYTYDSQGNYLKTVTTPIGNTTTLLPDANTGDTKEYTDALGNKFLYDYFMDGNAKTFTFPYQSTMGGPISNKSYTYEYDKSGNLTKIKDPNQNAVTVQYNEQNQVDKLTEVASNASGTPKSLVWDYNYDASGRLIYVKSANGKTTNLTYDLGNRIKSVQLGAKTFNYSFDRNSNMTGYGTGSSMFQAVFDEMNNVTKVTEPTTTRYIEAEYDAEGDRTHLSVVANASVFDYEYEYDSSGSPLRFTDELSGKSAYYLHDESGRLVKSFISGDMSTFYTYDREGRVATSRTELSGKVTGNWTYEYDAVGNLTRVTDLLDASKWLSYRYDSLGQLAEEETAQGKKTYSYDEMGNRTSIVDGGQTTNYTYNNEKNRLLSVGAKAYTYDDSGNVLSDGNNQYVWGDENKLSIVKNAAGTTTIASFDYDALGRRQTITSGGVTKTLHYDGNLVTYATNASNTILYRIGYDHNGRPVLFRSNNVNYWYQFNTHGDVVALLDDTGAVKVSYSYDAWGNHTSAAPTDATLKSVYENNPYRYAGSWYDQETGKYYLGARFYDPKIGRFLSKDPVSVRVGSHLGSNAYAYADNNPVMYADPHGEWVWIVVDIATGIALDYAMYKYGGSKGKFRFGASLRSNAAWSLVPGGGFAKKYKLAKKLLKMKRKSRIRGCNCFTAGTKVLTDEGEKNIEDIEVGDKVLSKDDDTGEIAYKEVEWLFQRDVEETYNITVGGEVITTTDEHPFWIVGKGWVESKNLVVGDVLTTSDGKELAIEKIEVKKEHKTVYNFKVKDFHTYFVSNLEVWTHNKCNLGPGKVNFTGDGVKHVKDRHIGNKSGWEHKSKWTVTGGHWRTYSRATIKNPDRISMDGDRFVYEKVFNKVMGVDANGNNLYKVRVVVDKNGNLVTAFPQAAWK